MSPTFDRRTLLVAAAGSGAAATVPLLPGSASAAEVGRGFDLDPAIRPPAAWFAGRGCGNQSGPRNLPQDRAADRVLCDTARPRIPRRDFLVTDFGAVGDGVTDSTAAIAATIAAASRCGGGRVVLPADPKTGAASYFTGPIHLQSRIELHVPAGVTVF
jgi:hypothetical protein